MFEEFFIKIPSYARFNKVRRVLSNEWLANLKKNYLTSGFFGTPFLCHQRNGVKEKKYQEKEKSTLSIRICMDFSAQNCSS